MATLDEIEAAAMQLAPQERSQLVNHLALSLDGSDDFGLPDLDPRWVEICERRLKDLDEGRTQPLDGEAVMSRLREAARQ